MWNNEAFVFNDRTAIRLNSEKFWMREMMDLKKKTKMQIQIYKQLFF